MLKRKIICILLAIILILGPSIASLAVDTNEENNSTVNTNEINDLNKQKDELDNKLEEANSRLEYVQGEMSSTLLEIQKLRDKIIKYESENKELDEKLSILQASISETTELLETVTAEYTQKDELLRQRLVVMYQEGELSFLDLLLSSTTLSEFLSRYYAMQKMAEYDNQLIDEVAERKNTIEISKTKLEKESNEVTVLKAKAEQNEIILENTKTMHEGYVKELSKEEKELNNKIDKYRTEYAEVQSKLNEISNDVSEFDIQYTGGKMLWPVAVSGTVITSNYGTRVYPLAGSSAVTDFHLGIDIAASAGSPIVAAEDGIVTYAGWLGSYGNCVMIYHGDGISTVYGHGRKVLTQKGAEVKQGDLIMEVGSTGNSTGPHCHFEVRKNGQTTNPLQFVNKP